MKRKNPLASLEKNIELLNKTVSSFDKRLESMDVRIDELVRNANMVRFANAGSAVSGLRARTEQFPEQTERSERVPEHLSKITGRHREILAMLINNGFHTYKDISKKLNISQSRARAYIAELKNKYNIPLRQVRDPEGYKVGVEMRFVEEVLSSK